MIENGCVQSPGGTCQKYELECSGSVYSKKKCPFWAEAFALEEFYRKKLNRETDKCR